MRIIVVRMKICSARGWLICRGFRIFVEPVRELVAIMDDVDDAILRTHHELADLKQLEAVAPRPLENAAIAVQSRPDIGFHVTRSTRPMTWAFAMGEGAPTLDSHQLLDLRSSTSKVWRRFTPSAFKDSMI